MTTQTMSLTAAIREAATIAIAEGKVSHVIYADYSGDHCLRRPCMIHNRSGAVRDVVTTPTHIRSLGHAAYLGCMDACRPLVHVGLRDGRWLMIECGTPDPSIIAAQIRNLI